MTGWPAASYSGLTTGLLLSASIYHVTHTAGCCVTIAASLLRSPGGEPDTVQAREATSCCTNSWGSSELCWYFWSSSAHWSKLALLPYRGLTFLLSEHFTPYIPCLIFTVWHQAVSPPFLRLPSSSHSVGEGLCVSASLAFRETGENHRGQIDRWGLFCRGGLYVVLIGADAGVTLDLWASVRVTHREDADVEQLRLTGPVEGHCRTLGWVEK